MSSRAFSYCVLLPAYAEGGRVGDVVRSILARHGNVVVIDDGSPDATAEEAERAGATVLRHEVNQGKGRALETGFRYAREQGYEVAVTMDADGQHAPEDIERFLAAYEQDGTPVLVGNRFMDARGMPWLRRFVNGYMSRLLSRRIGQHVPDTQNGFRLYRLDALPATCCGRESRFAAESEILIRLGRQGVAIGSVAVKTIYGDERSKIRPVRDTLRFWRMLRELDREMKKRSVKS